MDLDKLAKSFLKDVRPYKPGKPIEQLQRERGLPRIMKLASNENPYPPVERIRDAVAKAMLSSNRYPESGAPELTAKLAGIHGVTRDEIFVAHGTNEILDLLVRAYVNPDENCVFSALSFAIYRIVCQQCGVQWVEVPHREYRHDLEAMSDAVTNRTKIVWVCNPNNPTGTYSTADEVQRFLDRSPEHTLVALDEAYHEFVNASDYPDSSALRQKHENVIILRTFSKFYSLAGIRIGYAIADPRVVAVLNKMRQPFNVSRLAQAAALAALDCRDELQWVIGETIRERDAMREALLDMGCECPPSQTNFLFVVPVGYDGDACRALEDRGIIVRPMAPFGAPENTFRVNMGTPEENQAFVEAMKEILAPAA